LHLAQAIFQHSRPDTLIVVDCLTLWLTNWLMPADKPLPAARAAPNTPEGRDTCTEKFITNQHLAHMDKGQVALLLEAISNAAGPLVLVGNEIGLGVIPMGREVRAFVDALGLLNQSVAQVCQRVTLMAAGLPLTLKALL
jgi:adenosylcobinamide kinase / adenosylcobinamide-phosphate guanylyltransferase